MTDLLQLDFLLGISSGAFLTMAILRYMEQFRSGASADWPFTSVPLMFSGTFPWLAELFYRRRA
jgi:hypothetical protein